MKKSRLGEEQIDYQSHLRAPNSALLGRPLPTTLDVADYAIRTIRYDSAL